VHKVLREILVPPVLLDLLDNKVLVDTPVSLVKLDPEELMVCLVNLDPPVPWEPLDLPDFLEAPDQRENPV